jgi:prepilin-type N-terminal cleavage/methylation domain-containing protein
MTKPRIITADVRHSRRSRRGFSLVELTITLLIVGILAAVASPNFASALNEFRLDATAARIVADVKYVREYAINNSRSVPLRFKTGTTSAASCYLSTGPDAVPDLRHPTKTLRVDLNHVADGVILSSASFDGSDTVTFNEYGLPLAGNPSTQITSGSVVISCGGSQRTIVIDPSSGKARVQ